MPKRPAHRELSVVRVVGEGASALAKLCGLVVSSFEVGSKEGVALLEPRRVATTGHIDGTGREARDTTDHEQKLEESAARRVDQSKPSNSYLSDQQPVAAK